MAQYKNDNLVKNMAFKHTNNKKAQFTHNNRNLNKNDSVTPLFLIT